MVLEHRPSSSDAQAELDASGAMRLLVYSGVSETLVCYGRTDGPPQPHVHWQIPLLIGHGK